MASLFKRPDSKVWWTQYYFTDPETNTRKRTQRSTGKTNKKDAASTAAELERAAQGVIEARTDSGTRAKAVMARAVADVETGKFNVLSARRYMAELLEIATGEKMEFYTVETWFVEWLRRKARKSSKATVARYRSHSNRFLDFIGDQRTKPLESVTMDQVREWRDSVQDSGVVGKTVNNHLKDVRSIYKSAITEGLIAFNPAAAVELVDTDDSQERKPFSTEEVATLAGAAPTEEWRGVILVAAYAGLRLGDCAKLTWDTVNMEKETISLIPAKNRRKKRRVTVPIHPALLEYLEQAKITDDSPTAFVFPGLAKLKVNNRTGLSETFTDIMEASGVDRGMPSRPLDSDKGKGRITWERGFHSFRHTFTTWLRTAGVSEEDRMALTGHSTREVHQGYSHVTPEAKKTAIDKLPTITKTDK